MKQSNNNMTLYEGENLLETSIVFFFLIHNWIQYAILFFYSYIIESYLCFYLVLFYFIRLFKISNMCVLYIDLCTCSTK